MSTLEDLPDLTDTSAVPETKSIFKGICINCVDTPNELNWYFESIYKDSQTGGILIWTIGFNNESKELLIQHGYYLTKNKEYGKLQLDNISVDTNQSGRSLQDQALLQSRKRYQDKIKEGYHSAIEKSLFKFPAQQATKYDPVNGNSFKEINLKRGIACQLKIDGIRGRFWKGPTGVECYSRKNNEYKYLNHIKKDIEELLLLLPDQCGIDTELYNHNMKFEEIISAIKTINHEHERNKDIVCYIFDIILPNVVFEKRVELLNNAYNIWKSSHLECKHICLLPHTIVHSAKDIDSIQQQSVFNGYEGLMIRKCIGITVGYTLDKLSRLQIEETWYKGNRNNNLMKYKNFNDDEGIIKAVKCGTGREENLAIFTIESKDGKLFDCRPKGSFEIRAKWYTSPELCIGKKYTYRYFELTDSGIPRFPCGVAFRDYE
jgi:hypothetical protein